MPHVHPPRSSPAADGRVHAPDRCTDDEMPIADLAWARAKSVAAAAPKRRHAAAGRRP